MAGPLLQLGLGVDYSTYGLEGTNENVRHLDFFVSARRYTNAPATRFYWGGKIGYVRQSSDATEGITGLGTVTASGFALGPVVGVQVPVGAVALEGAVDVLYHSHGSFALDGVEVEGLGGLRLPLDYQGGSGDSVGRLTDRGRRRTRLDCPIHP